jgi:hypothetical protein
MKTKLFLVAVFSLFLSLAQTFASANSNISGNDPDVKVVVSQKRIWLVTDEISVKSLSVRVLNEKGKVVMEKQFSSKVTDWSLRIESLPEGRYTVEVGEKKITDFSR